MRHTLSEVNESEYLLDHTEMSLGFSILILALHANSLSVQQIFRWFLTKTFEILQHSEKVL